ncbi:MAG: hypothetical protein M3217_08125 [Actinomycetota bacterium]|nr:hypothetical protein [Actinomycetota bacterium]
MRLRRAIAFLSAVALFGVGNVVPAVATADPVPPIKRPIRSVRATGDYFTSLNPEGKSVYYTCAGVSGPDSAATVLTECSIWVNGVFQANYPVGASGNVAVSSGRHDGPVGVVMVCYQAKAMFTDGSTMYSDRGCISVS